jgi:hypothetical protein
MNHEIAVKKSAMTRDIISQMSDSEVGAAFRSILDQPILVDMYATSFNIPVAELRSILKEYSDSDIGKMCHQIINCATPDQFEDMEHKFRIHYTEDDIQEAGRIALSSFRNRGSSADALSTIEISSQYGKVKSSGRSAEIIAEGCADGLRTVAGGLAVGVAVGAGVGLAALIVRALGGSNKK